MAAAIARAIPVLPLVASISVSPGLIRPDFSASVIMLKAGLKPVLRQRGNQQDRVIQAIDAKNQEIDVSSAIIVVTDPSLILQDCCPRALQG
jgi:hypothetical protein